MSGGHFDYKQYEIQYIIDSIEQLIISNNELDEYGYANHFPDDVLDEFRKGIKMLEIAQVYAQRIDWLVSGDDGVNTFKERLTNDLSRLNKRD